MFRLAPVFCSLILLSGPVCGGTEITAPDIIISVREQKLVLVQDGGQVATYPISTSKFGLGDRWGSMATPLGFLQVALNALDAFFDLLDTLLNHAGLVGQSPTNSHQERDDYGDGCQRSIGKGRLVDIGRAGLAKQTDEHLS